MRRCPLSYNCSAQIVVCGQESMRKEVWVPGGKSGLWRSGVIGSKIEEISYFQQVSRREVKVDSLSG